VKTLKVNSLKKTSSDQIVFTLTFKEII
jgi:hypothetical protein